jgi:hypothetical protein
MSESTYVGMSLSSWEASVNRPFLLVGDPEPKREGLWNRYKDIQEGPADLEALLRRTEERFEHRSQQLTDARNAEGTYEVMDDELRADNIESLRKIRRDERLRVRVLSVMLDMYLLYGEVPPWDEVPGDTLESNDPSIDNLPRKEVQRYGKQSDVQERRYRIHQHLIERYGEIPSEVSEGEKQDLLTDSDSVTTHAVEEDLNHLRKEFGS